MSEFKIEGDRPWFKFWPKNMPKYLEIPEKGLHELFEETAKRLPDKTALIFEGKKITFSELDKYSSSFANFLQSIGIKKGDRVAIYLPNMPQFAIAFFGILKAGAIVVPHNPLYVERELEHQLNDCGARAIITLDVVGDVNFYQRVATIKDKTKLEHVIATNLGDFLPGIKAVLGRLLGKVPKKKKYPSTYDLMDILKKYPPKYNKVEINSKEDLALFQYTGGTTGVPKGAMLTHYNLISNALQIRSWAYVTEEDVMMGVLPFFHIYGLTVSFVSSMLTGNTVIVVPRFEVKHVLELVQKYKVTLFPGVPTMYIAMINHPDLSKYDLSSIRACISGAAPLPVIVRKKFMEITGGILVEGYGLSEASPVTHINPMDDPEKIRDGSIGLPIPNTDAKIVDVETGEDLPIGEVGELAVRGPQVMKGYWNMPEETKKVLVNGWLRTGDIAKMDEDGYFYIVDRKKDMINAAGYKVWPREIEEVLFKHPKVKEAAVIGVPDPYRGETVKAYIVPKDEYADVLTDESKREEFIKELDAFCREHLAAYKVPRLFEFRKELPKSLVGKVLRRVLKEEATKTSEEKQ
ncbi:MAG: long-chain-fatty-acid--CoA ligase [Candidatus Njordarchaeia archaeon]